MTFDLYYFTMVRVFSLLEYVLDGMIIDNSTGKTPGLTVILSCDTIYKSVPTGDFHNGLPV